MKTDITAAITSKTQKKTLFYEASTEHEESIVMKSNIRNHRHRGTRTETPDGKKTLMKGQNKQVTRAENTAGLITSTNS